MDLSDYTEISGLEVKDSQRAFVAANINHARFGLEAALGFPLDTDAAKQNLYNERGITYSAMKDWQPGIQDYRKIIDELDPQRFVAYKNLSWLYNRMGNKAEAEKWLEKGNKLKK